MTTMGAQSENFKGIEFIRISSLPKTQQEKIWTSFQHDKIIKIIKDKALMNDCIVYGDYVSWLKDQQTQALKTPMEAPILRVLGKLAFE